MNKESSQQRRPNPLTLLMNVYVHLLAIYRIHHSYTTKKEEKIMAATAKSNGIKQVLAINQVEQQFNKFPNIFLWWFLFFFLFGHNSIVVRVMDEYLFCSLAGLLSFILLLVSGER